MRQSFIAGIFLFWVAAAIGVGTRVQASSPSSNWQGLALKLHSENPQELEAAIHELRGIRGLDSILRKELGGEHSDEALDVIAALSFQGLIPDLLRGSENDDDGFVYGCLNALLTPENRSQIVPTYRARIEKPGEGLTAPAKVAILAGLQKVREPLAPRALEPLLADQDYQVRISAAEYLESLLPALENRTEYEALIKKSLNASPYQLRLTSIRMLRALGSPFQRTCKDDPNSEVRAACSKWEASK